jgi:major membrane immunogen (membrane-anchored lipoprotein)
MADNIDGGLANMAQQFTGLPMDTLIGAPLHAAAGAQQSLAMTQTQYILNTGFSQKKDEKNQITYTPITASIAMGQSQPVVAQDGSVTAATSRLNVDFPIITMVPIPSLAVTSVDITFDMEVKSSYSHDTDTETASKTHEEGSFDAKGGWGCLSVEVKGSVSHDNSQSNSDKQSYTKSNDAKYHVEVKAEQQPVPDGIKMLLDMFSKNMTMTPIMVNSKPVPIAPPA